MKFAKELEEDLVPEWRAKYFNYKQGKKKVKAIARALRNVDGGPKTPGRRKPSNMLDDNGDIQSYTPSSFTYYRFPALRKGLDGQDESGNKPQSRRQMSSTMFMTTPPMPIPERTPLQEAGNTENGALGRSYGSIIATPPARELPSLELPDPALSPYARSQEAARAGSNAIKKPGSDAYHVGGTKSPRKAISSLPRRLMQPKRAASQPGPGPSPKPALLRRMFSNAGVDSPATFGDVSLQAYHELDARQDEFFNFLDHELDKIEEFYKLKEKEASARLQSIREQLHEMRDRRMEELNAAHEVRELKKNGNANGEREGNGVLNNVAISKALEEAIGKRRRFGKTTAGMTSLGSPDPPAQQKHDNRRDYTRKPHPDSVPYRAAKRKLKLAMQEYYRGLELLKSYALLNRTAFRKINKKYDKAVNARPTGRYMSEKVNKAWFVQSEVVDGYIVAIEDLYARYFERGNHKVAVGKLRRRTPRTGAHTASAFRNGLLLAGGAALGIEGLVHGARHLDNLDPVVSTQASYLLQIYGGYALGLLLFLMFVLNCRIWTKAKINYPFIFEYDARNVLDWRQLAELPCLFFFLLGLFLWLNFRPSGSDSMYIWWPLVLIALTMFLILFPGPVLYWHSRQWWAYSHWRLMLAGLYPVEFRDFFLGDMYCSQTYAMGNIELFFCLYINDWHNPPQCNSSHSRLLGFFSALPAVWRALQCIRRYYDSRNWFPHLVNCGKYSFNILFYMSLSLYRIHKTHELRAVFIFFGTINAIYSSIWDLGMDWSLLNPYARYPFLRNTLGYRHVWMYYAAMVLDPVLRFNWIFYAIYSSELQHSAILSFLVALSEVGRRGVWTLLRVENEHCTNVGRFRASRDVPLPYSLPSSSKASLQPSPQIAGQQEEERPGTTTGMDIERAESGGESPLRLRKTRTPQIPHHTPTTIRGIHRMGTILTEAHAQDYEKKRRPGVVGESPASVGMAGRDDVDSSDEEEDGGNTTAEEDTDENASDPEVREAQRMTERARSPEDGIAQSP